MKRSSTDLGTPRRLFLAVLVVLVLVLAWNLSKPWRTGIQEHRVSYGSKLDRIFGGSSWLSLGTNYIWWTYRQDGSGYLYTAHSSTPTWEVAACAQTDLRAVTSQDGRGEFVGRRQDGSKMFGQDWQTNHLVIHDGQIVLLRHATDTQTVYALEVVEQRDSAGYFRSRKILHASNNDAAGRHP